MITHDPGLYLSPTGQSVAHKLCVGLLLLGYALMFWAFVDELLFGALAVAAWCPVVLLRWWIRVSEQAEL